MRIPLPKGLKRTGMLDKIESEYPMEKPNDDILKDNAKHYDL